MKFTLFRKSKTDNKTTLQCVEANEFIISMNECIQQKLISEYREIFLALGKSENWGKLDQFIRVCPVSEYYRNKQGEHLWRRYNGVSIVEIRGINNALQLEKAKKQVSLFPQVMAAFAGADGYSVIALTLATLPDGSLPRKEEDALLFATKAYALSVQSIQPTLEFPISISEPSLSKVFLRSYDPEPYLNPHAQPFIFEQPGEMDIKQLAKPTDGHSPLYDMKPGYQSYATFTKIFNAVFARALANSPFITDKNSEDMMVLVAEECADVDLPQEETTIRIHRHFHDHAIEDIRQMVQNVYAQKSGDRVYSAFSKHQNIAYRLREFLDRRYDIRFNEVLQMTEFRERHAINFFYRELSRRELNTIHHEALIEGIEPTFGEVDELVHSSRIPLYNPVEDYLSHLPKWDGTDHIGKLADTVPTDNPHWQRLFRQWFLSMVAHWMNGDELHANSTAPILIGAQGYRKSTFCRQLLPPELQMFYTDSIDFRTNIEAERTLSRFMLVNIDEFDQLSEKQFAFVKHLFQKPVSHIRRMYCETIASQRRYASFIGTTNSDEVLRDPTGNRRYLCVMVTDVIRTEEKINHAQLYAQAVHLINSGERYWINDEDERLIRQTNARFEVQQPLEHLFHDAFEPSVSLNTEGAEWLRATEIMTILQSLPAFNRKTDNNIHKLGHALTKLQIIKRHSRLGTEYLVKRKGM